MSVCNVEAKSRNPFCELLICLFRRSNKNSEFLNLNFGSEY
jgi:hypothetical protein